MKYAVEARIFDNGEIVTKVRQANEGETNGSVETQKCDIWIDVFDTKEEAVKFAREYKLA